MTLTRPTRRDRPTVMTRSYLPARVLPCRVSSAVAWAVLAVGGGCVEERVIYSDPPLAGVPGAVTGAPVVGVSNPRGVGQVPDDEVVLPNPDGTFTLRQRNFRQLFLNIRWCLDEDRPGEFVRHVLSSRTRDEYLERGLNPADALKTIRARRDDFNRLLASMPGGELTPGLYVKTLGPNTFRLEVTDRSADRLAWNGIDAVFEGGNYRLRWFVPNPRYDPELE
ncbi:MAG: hypothetical protein HRU70_14830 [Phycisphaeraceae bacterium]|nr:MAG: hypothetical protein HRU70_14830 [Phycisphaeraceae bacterium]